jgi:hypothetical protein
MISKMIKWVFFQDKMTMSLWFIAALNGAVMKLLSHYATWAFVESKGHTLAQWRDKIAIQYKEEMLATLSSHFQIQSTIQIVCLAIIALWLVLNIQRGDKESMKRIFMLLTTAMLASCLFATYSWCNELRLYYTHDTYYGPVCSQSEIKWLYRLEEPDVIPEIVIESKGGRQYFFGRHMFDRGKKVSAQFK